MVGQTPEAAAARVIGHGGRRGDLAIILGTGLGDLADRLEDRVSLPAEATGWLPPSRAIGHAGRVVCGRVGRVDVVALQGRVHAYEGHGRDVIVRGVQLAAALGCTRILLTNASGGLVADMVPGEVVVITDHIDLSLGVVAATCRRPFGRSPYDPALVERACAVGRRQGHATRRGVYAFVPGPSYETRAEYRWLRGAGADVVGMSTVPEVAAASGLGMRVLGLSVVTNVARPDAPVATDAEEVCTAAAGAGDLIWAILEDVACGS